MALDYHLDESEKHHQWTRRLEGVDNAETDVKVHVHDGKLLILVKGQEIENVQLPDNAYTNDARATYQRGVLKIEMSAKDPNSPAMVEKKMLDPDRPHPREVPLVLLGKGLGHIAGIPLKEDPLGRGAPTPAQAEFGSRNDELFGRPHVHAAMPAANLASTLATDMPVLTHPGGAVEAAADKGETVVADPWSSETKLYVPHLDQVTERLGRAEIAPPGATAVRGARDKVVEREYEAYGGGDVGGGRDQIEHVPVDYAKEKVGMATRPLEARDFYQTCDSKTEPYSSLKMQNYEEGIEDDIDQCAPSQLDKMAKGNYDHTYMLTPQETKRANKMHMSSARQAACGRNAHSAHGSKHSKAKEHAQSHMKDQEFEDNVHMEGTGSLEDFPPHQREEIEHKVTGGREIDPELVRDHTRAKELAQHLMG